MSDMTAEQQPKRRVGIDDLLFDLFGLNVRAAQSVGVLFVAPRRYFEAADESEWADRFTPSVRLWFSILTVMILLRFLWAGEGSAFLTTTVQQLEQIGILQPSQGTMADLAQAMIGWQLAYLPFITILLIMPLCMIYPFWGPNTPIALRVRYGFATIIPSNFISLLLTISLGFVGQGLFGAIVLASTLTTLLVDTVTGVRGAYRHCGFGGRLARAIGFSVSVLTMVFLAGIIAQIASVVTVVHLGVAELAEVPPS